MNTVQTTDWPVRQEIVDTHTAAAAHWAAPGTWWTATERIAIVNEVRSAWDADALPAWTPPSSVAGLISDDHVLPAAAIDVIWRLTNHVQTLTHDWYQNYVPDQLTPGQYVEIVGVVAQVTLVDRFADALSLDRIAVPPAAVGEPSGEEPADAAVRLHWVPTAPIVDGSRNPGEPTDVSNVRKALSLVASERIMQWTLIDAHYLQGGAPADDFAGMHWSLTRSQIELIGTRTSKVNECFY